MIQVDISNNVWTQNCLRKYQIDMIKYDNIENNFLRQLICPKSVYVQNSNGTNFYLNLSDAISLSMKFKMSIVLFKYTINIVCVHLFKVISCI